MFNACNIALDRIPIKWQGECLENFILKDRIIISIGPRGNL